MNKSIIVGLVALGLTACGGAVEDQPTDAVTAEAPAAEVSEPEAAAAEAPAADAGVVGQEEAAADVAVVDAPAAE
jgi:hypothetical protein